MTPIQRGFRPNESKTPTGSGGARKVDHIRFDKNGPLPYGYEPVGETSIDVGLTWLILAIAALLTSVLSGMIGMGGGILLLAVLFSFLSHAEAIPTHATVQIASNGTRVLVFLRSVDWRTIRRFWWGALPGAALGSALLWTLGALERSEPYLKSGVGVYILTATFLPSPKKVETDFTWWDFPLIGFIAGTASLTVGAIGPLIAPIFARRSFLKERLIATKAVCQLSCHVLKIPAFILLTDLSLPKLGWMTVIMVAMVIPGTMLGKRLLSRLPDRHFITLYRVALVAAGLKVLIVDGLWPLFRPAGV